MPFNRELFYQLNFEKFELTKTGKIGFSSRGHP